MSIEQFLNRVLNETPEEDDEYLSVVEVYDDEYPEEDEWEDEIHTKLEAIKKVRVIRNGKPTFIARSTKPGYKIAHGKEFKMNVYEKRAREKAAEHTYIRKKKHLSDQQQEARQKSISKRKDFGLEEE